MLKGRGPCDIAQGVVIEMEVRKASELFSQASIHPRERLKGKMSPLWRKAQHLSQNAALMATDINAVRVFLQDTLHYLKRLNIV